MRKFNGIPRDHFYPFLKECEWRFNNSDQKYSSIHINQLINKEMGN